MNDSGVLKLISNLSLKESEPAELIETHISWVILSGKYAYKIKKPITTSFLNFKSLKKRKSYTERELKLNKRLAAEVYIAVKPISSYEGEVFIGTTMEGKIIDYALVMKRMENEKRMDVMLGKDKVSQADIKRIAIKLASFHLKADVVKKADTVGSTKKTFEDLGSMVNVAERYLEEKYVKLIDDSINQNDRFINTYQPLFQLRIKNGFIRDVHGDLHTANIFLYKDPVIYDCIEFNDAFRTIDLLYEVAFLCMDLEKWGRKDLSDLFIKEYLKKMGWRLSGNELNIFIYYKALRANIRAKVCLMRLEQLSDKKIIRKEVKTVKMYLELMKRYLSVIK